MLDNHTELLNPKETEEKTNAKLTKLIAIVVVVVAIISALIFILVTVVFNATRPVTQRAGSFANYLVKNDATNAYAISSKGFKIGTDQGQLKQYFTQLNQALGGGSIKLLDKEVLIEKNVSYGSVTYKIHKDQKDYYLLVQLIKEDGIWKIHNFQTSQSKLEPGLR